MDSNSTHWLEDLDVENFLGPPPEYPGPNPKQPGSPQSSSQSSTQSESSQSERDATRTKVNGTGVKKMDTWLVVFCLDKIAGKARVTEHELLEALGHDFQHGRCMAIPTPNPCVEVSRGMAIEVTCPRGVSYRHLLETAMIKALQIMKGTKVWTEWKTPNNQQLVDW